MLGLALVAYASAFLSIDIESGWTRLHEDNGAMHTSFAISGSADPPVARMVPIGFHLISLILTVVLLATFFSTEVALLGGFLVAILPMGAYFGRMVNYEPSVCSPSCSNCSAM